MAKKINKSYLAELFGAVDNKANIVDKKCSIIIDDVEYTLNDLYDGVRKTPIIKSIPLIEKLQDAPNKVVDFYNVLDKNVTVLPNIPKTVKDFKDATKIVDNTCFISIYRVINFENVKVMRRSDQQWIIVEGVDAKANTKVCINTGLIIDILSNVNLENYSASTYPIIKQCKDKFYAANKFCFPQYGKLIIPKIYLPSQDKKTFIPIVCARDPVDTGFFCVSFITKEEIKNGKIGIHLCAYDTWPANNHLYVNVEKDAIVATSPTKPKDNRAHRLIKNLKCKSSYHEAYLEPQSDSGTLRNVVIPKFDHIEGKRIRHATDKIIINAKHCDGAVVFISRKREWFCDTVTAPGIYNPKKNILHIPYAHESTDSDMNLHCVVMLKNKLDVVMYTPTVKHVSDNKYFNGFFIDVENYKLLNKSYEQLFTFSNRLSKIANTTMDPKKHNCSFEEFIKLGDYHRTVLHGEVLNTNLANLRQDENQLLEMLQKKPMSQMLHNAMCVVAIINNKSKIPEDKLKLLYATYIPSLLKTDIQPDNNNKGSEENGILDATIAPIDPTNNNEEHINGCGVIPIVTSDAVTYSNDVGHGFDTSAHIKSERSEENIAVEPHFMVQSSSSSSSESISEAVEPNTIEERSEKKLVSYEELRNSTKIKSPQNSTANPSEIDQWIEYEEHNQSLLDSEYHDETSPPLKRRHVEDDDEPICKYTRLDYEN